MPRAPSSGFARPRSATSRCSASIAVYVGSTTSSPPSGVSASPRSSAALERRLDDDARLVEAAVLEAERELGRALAGGDDRLEPVEQRLEVDVPDPRHVTAVGDRVVQRDDGDARRAAVDERAHDLVRAGRILDQEEQELLAVDRDALEPAERGAEAREPGGDLVERRAERLRECRGAERVVDVVEAGQRELDALRAGRA